MPELPEVEVLRRCLNPALQGRRLKRMQVLNASLRWPVSSALAAACSGQTLLEVGRRSKYLLFRFPQGTMLVHLGMSGTVQLVAPGTPLQKHDHVTWEFDGDACLRFNDPRRFGSLLWLDESVSEKNACASLSADSERAQSILNRLGPEPFDGQFSGEHLYRMSRRRKPAVKPWLLSGVPVVGVGNIYACEALFRAGIDPRRSAGSISLARYQRLSRAIIDVLAEAISAGGSTLRDFTSAHGEPGAFQERYAVYGRHGEACAQCGASIKRLIQAQLSIFACLSCQR